MIYPLVVASWPGWRAWGEARAFCVLELVPFAQGGAALSVEEKESVSPPGAQMGVVSSVAGH